MNAMPAFELPPPDEEEEAEPSWMSHKYAGPPAPLIEETPEITDPEAGWIPDPERMRVLNEWIAAGGTGPTPALLEKPRTPGFVDGKEAMELWREQRGAADYFERQRQGLER